MSFTRHELRTRPELADSRSIHPAQLSATAIGARQAQRAHERKESPDEGPDDNAKASTKRVTSGIERLDVMSSSGFFRDSIILGPGATGTGKTLER